MGMHTQARAGRALTRALTLLTVFALSMPLFWMIDIMQAQRSAHAPHDSHSTQQTLRFDESRSEHDKLEVTSDEQTPDDTGLGMRNADGEQHAPILLSHAPAAVIREAFLLSPALTARERQRISRLLIPLDPVQEVPTTPPLVAV